MPWDIDCTDMVFHPSVLFASVVSNYISERKTSGRYCMCELMSECLFHLQNSLFIELMMTLCVFFVVKLKRIYA